MSVRRTQHSRSSIAGAVPDAADVLVGEIIINLTDRTLRTKNGAGALIRMNQSTIVTDVEPSDPNLGDWYLTTAGQIRAYFNPGTGIDWYDVLSPEDLSGYLLKSGGSMTGQLTLPGGGGASQALTVTEATALASAAVATALLKTGGTMTGQITLPGGGGASQALQKSEIEALIAAAVPPDLSLVVLKTGSVMTGQLTLPGGGAGNQAASVNELAAAIATHAAQPDPHTAYTLTTELNAFIAGHVAVGGAAQHPVATGAVAGFMSSADKTKLDGLGGFITESFLIALSNETAVITTGVAKMTFRMPYAFTLTSVKASLNVAGTVAATQVDINEGGVSILSTKLTIDVSEKTSVTAAVPAVISDAALAADAEITFDIDVAGTDAKGLKVYLIGHQ